MKIFLAKTILLLILFMIISANNNSIANYANFKIKILGNERVNSDSIKSYLDITNLQTGELRYINNSLKKLYNTDLFSKASIYKESEFIIIEVKENPIIKDIIFEGNKKIDDDILASEIRLTKRSVYNKSKLESDIKRINDIYIKSGRFLTEIKPKIKEEDDNRISLIFEIFEGKLAKIADINFIGNYAFSDRKLNDEITTRKSKWYKLFSNTDLYDSDRIEFDKEKLRLFYNSKGYADFNVISANAQITQTKDRFFINFLLEEGKKYKFGDIKIINKIKKFNKSKLQKYALTEKYKTYNNHLIEKTIDEFTDVISQDGFTFTEIKPIIDKDEKNKTIDVTYLIKESPRIYIDQINISGNDRTLDEVIRRELRIREGDPYNFTKINRSKQRINNLGFFEQVDFKTNRIGNSDKVSIKIEVKEKRTGELNLGIGYSSFDRITANVGMRETNLLGTGRELGVNLQQSSNRSNNQINYTKPYFLERDISAGIDVFNVEQNKMDSLVYNKNSLGFALRAGYPVLEHVYHSLRYSYSDEEVDDVDVNASVIFKNLEGKFINSSLSHSLSIDRRDNRFKPKKGYFASASQTYSGIGGDIKLLKQEVKANYYVPVINNNFILKFSGKFGYVDGLGQDVRSNDHFFLGGNNFRGFEFAGLGPRTIDKNGNAKGGDAIGGKMYYVSSTELKFPLGLPKDLGISAALFYDIGTLRMVDRSNKLNSQIADSGSLRSSYGFSIVWSSPMGPMRFDFSNINRSEDYDITESFRFNFGTTF